MVKCETADCDTEVTKARLCKPCWKNGLELERTRPEREAEEEAKWRRNRLARTLKFGKPSLALQERLQAISREQAAEE